MLRRSLILTLLMFGFLAAAMGAEKEKPLPKDMPPYGALKPFAAPQASAQRLSNGLTLWLVPRPGFPKVAFAFVAHGGMAADPRDLPGLSQLLASTIDQGTKTRNARRIAEELQAAGGDLSASAESDSVGFTSEVLASKADSALAVLADILQNATFPDSEVDIAKRNAADSLRAQEAEPGFLARRALAKALFADHPYSVISGTQESISKTTAADLRREYARRFRSDQMIVVAVGDFEPTHMTATFQNLFGKWAAPQESPVPDVPAAPKASPHEIFFVGRQGSVQTTFALGALGPSEKAPDFAATEVANALFGGMFGSRLINNIREDKGYTYSPGAFVQSRRATGLLRTQADVRNAVTGASLNEIAYELNRMATTAPEEDEVARAQRYLVGVRAISLQSGASVARQLASLWVQALPPEELGLLSERILKVTAQDVTTIGRQYFPAARQTIVAVGEEKVIREQLAPFGLEVKPAP